jgi:hypothetical protein
MAGFDMLSGPDLGGGFLFQLTIERRPEGALFLYHAQDGGADAAGPPVGSPEPFGWQRASGMCPVGGRVCWHRDFVLDEAQSPQVRAAYGRTRFVMEACLGQAYRGAPAAVGPALAELIARAPPPGPGTSASWAFVGPTALWLAGRGPPPGRIEVEDSAQGLRAWAGRLAEYLIEPPATTTWAGGARRFAARAFLGTFRDGARVEWSEPEPGSSAPEPPRREVEWNGQRVPVRLPA